MKGPEFATPEDRQRYLDGLAEDSAYYRKILAEVPPPLDKAWLEKIERVVRENDAERDRVLGMK